MAILGTLKVTTSTDREIVTAQLYGESHFVHSFQGQSRSLARPLHLVLPLVGILGGVAPMFGLLGLTALGWSRRRVLTGVVVVSLGYVLLACVPAEIAVFLRDAATGRTVLTLDNLVFGGFGLLVCGVAILTAWQLVCGSRRRVPARRTELIRPSAWIGSWSSG